MNMNRNNIAWAMIRSAVEKGIADIQENPGRGIRSLVDLGALFADGPYQKDFFGNAYRELLDDDSVYYRIVERVIAGTDSENLTSFGMNLGYNSWTRGARIIRALEEQNGFNIPWCILFDMTGGHISPEMVSDAIRQGKKLGVFTYIFLNLGGNADPYMFRDFAAREADCAMILFSDPCALTPAFIRQVGQAKNTWINMDISEDSKAVRETANILRESRCFYGGCVRCDDTASGANSALARAAELDIPFLTFISEKGNRPDNRDGEKDAILALRRNPEYPVLPIGLYSDIALIDRNISTEECITTILPDGMVLTADFQKSHTEMACNIKDTPLHVILRRTMPKNQKPAPV